MNGYNDIKVQVLDEQCIPKVGKYGDAGTDLRCAEHTYIPPLAKKIVGVGVAFGLNRDMCGIVTHRSSLAFKFGCTVSYGLIDSSFTGEVKICIFNHSHKGVYFKKGTRVAQIRFAEVPLTRFKKVDNLVAGKEGFGSSGGYDG